MAEQPVVRSHTIRNGAGEVVLTWIEHVDPEEPCVFVDGLCSCGRMGFDES